MHFQDGLESIGYFDSRTAHRILKWIRKRVQKLEVRVFFFKKKRLGRKGWKGKKEQWS